MRARNDEHKPLTIILFFTGGGGWGRKRKKNTKWLSGAESKVCFLVISPEEHEWTTIGNSRSDLFACSFRPLGKS